MESLAVFYIILGIFALVLEALVASKFESIANEKGFSGYFWWCFLFNIIGYIMVAALPDKSGTDNIQKTIIHATEKLYSSPNQNNQPQPQQTYWNNNLPPL